MAQQWTEYPTNKYIFQPFTRSDVLLLLLPLSPLFLSSGTLHSHNVRKFSCVYLVHWRNCGAVAKQPRNGTHIISHSSSLSLTSWWICSKSRSDSESAFKAVIQLNSIDECNISNWIWCGSEGKILLIYINIHDVVNLKRREHAMKVQQVFRVFNEQQKWQQQPVK